VDKKTQNRYPLIKLKDLLIHTLLPILIGILIYKWDFCMKLIKNYLPDFLWAYAFASCILIIWNRKINIFWYTLSFIVCICFEIAQFQEIINGTGDIVDIAIYTISFIFAIVINLTLNKKYEN
jgi:hypothetical protein